MKQTLINNRAFWALLPKEVGANLVFAQLVAKGDAVQQAYFFGEYSKPILSHIITKGMLKSYRDGDERDIMGEYYEFVTEPTDSKGKPEWYQLRSYKGLRGEKLQSWLQRNGSQWFAARQMRDNGGFTGGRRSAEERKKMRPRSLDDMFANLQNRLFEECDYDAEEQYRHQHLKLREAVESLPLRERDVLCVMVAEDMSWQQEWEALDCYMTIKYTEQTLDREGKKRVQDALANLKRHAVRELRKLIKN